MDFELNDDQRSIVQAVDKILERYAGAERARTLNRDSAYDTELHASIRESGFFELVRGDETGPLEAALVLEAIAKKAGVVAYGASALVAPAVIDGPIPGPIAITMADDTGPTRYGAHAKTLLISDGDDVFVRSLSPDDAEPVKAGYGYPLARVKRDGGDRLPGAGPRLRAWWRVALAMEAAGSMGAALDFTVDYVKERYQFGRPIGSFQALQHRLAESKVLAEGSRWLAYEAAWSNATEEASAIAAAYAVEAAKRIFFESHQLNGAIGFTREHDLHVWSMRLQTLRLEMQGASQHRLAAARARWADRVAS